jgi:hypothetical protein
MSDYLLCYTVLKELVYIRIRNILIQLRLRATHFVQPKIPPDAAAAKLKSTLPRS